MQTSACGGFLCSGRPGAAEPVGLGAALDGVPAEGEAVDDGRAEPWMDCQAFGACEERSVEHVRPHEDDELMDSSWRPVDPERDHFEPKAFPLAACPDDRTVPYWWRYRDTGFWRPATG